MDWRRIQRFVRCQADVPLHQLCTWRTGGMAKLFWQAQLDRVGEVLDFCRAEGVPVYYLGRGSNVLIADTGLPGLVISTPSELKEIAPEESRLRVEAGVPLRTVAEHAAREERTGFEFMIGIPGTAGAGAALNAGISAGGLREMAHVLDEVEYCDRGGQLHREKADAIRFEHRSSDLLRRGDLVTRCWFKFDTQAARAEILESMREILESRKATQPLTKSTAGSTFKRPVGGEPAAVYIDRAGLKGSRVGGAVVSPKHANFIENDGTATASDIRNLIREVQNVVQKKYGVALEREVRFLPEDTV